MPKPRSTHSVVGLRADAESKRAWMDVQPSHRVVVDTFPHQAAVELAYVLELAALGALELNRTAFASRCRVMAQRVRERRGLPPDAGRLPDDAGGSL